MEGWGAAHCQRRTMAQDACQRRAPRLSGCGAGAILWWPRLSALHTGPDGRPGSTPPGGRPCARASLRFGQRQDGTNWSQIFYDLRCTDDTKVPRPDGRGAGAWWGERGQVAEGGTSRAAASARSFRDARIVSMLLASPAPRPAIISACPHMSATRSACC